VASKVLFVAPHQDDVCFSLGALVSSTGVEKQLVTMFTQSQWSEPGWTGGRDRESVTAAKRAEDLAFCSEVGLAYHDVGLPDPTVRRGPSGKGAVYDCRKKARDDGPLRDSAANALRELIDDEGFDVVVGPLGVGAHRDHVLANQALRRAARALRVPLVFYEDLPYSQKVPLWRIALRAQRVSPGAVPLVFRSRVPAARKLEMASLYRSQFSPVILRAIEEHSRRLAEWAGGPPDENADGEAFIVERLWTSDDPEAAEELFDSAERVV
jgi:LmbE family N-acetylglucosaminyl deacetylase